MVQRVMLLNSQSMISHLIAPKPSSSQSSPPCTLTSREGFGYNIHMVDSIRACTNLFSMYNIPHTNIMSESNQSPEWRTKPKRVCCIPISNFSNLIWGDQVDWTNAIATLIFGVDRYLSPTTLPADRYLDTNLDMSQFPRFAGDNSSSRFY